MYIDSLMRFERGTGNADARRKGSGERGEKRGRAWKIVIYLRNIPSYPTLSNPPTCCMYWRSAPLLVHCGPGQFVLEVHWGMQSGVSIFVAHAPTAQKTRSP